jgi:hypothetical protein
VLSSLYLIMRIEAECIISKDPHCYRSYYEKFRKGGHNPIYTDRYGFNELFLEFLLPYGVELSDLTPTNKFMAQFLDLDFSKTSDPQQVPLCLFSSPLRNTSTPRPTTAQCSST